MRKFLSQALALILIFVAAVTAKADVVVPGAYANLEGPSSFSLTSTAAAGRTYQMTIDAGQLSTVVGQDITGVQWRLNGPATANWPSVDTSFSFFDVYIGAGVDPSAVSNTFASNFTGSVFQVRSGAHTFLANSFSSGGSPNAFGPTLAFDSSYLYAGGDLTVEFRFSAQSGATNQPAFDGIAVSGGPGNGYGVDFASRWTANATGTTGTAPNFLVTNFTTSPVPETSSIGLIGLAFAGIVLRRKRK